jgi:F0F1-type ATP synthase membrane subunit b/b'
MAYEIGNMVSSQEDINALFSGTEEVLPPVEEPDKEEKDKNPEEKIENTVVTEMPLEELFGEASERVGNEDDNPEGEEREPSTDDGSSPDKLYSSIANSLAEDGTLSNLSEDDLKEVKDSTTLMEALKKQVNSMLDEEQQRIKSALDSGMEVSKVKQYENTIKYLDTITEESITLESKEGETLRRNLIYNYHIALGLSEDKANKMVDRAFTSGTDVEDAKEYLDALKEHYSKEYNQLIEDGKKQIQENKKKQEEEVKKVKESLLKDSNILGDIEIDAKTRQKALDNWMKPTHRNEEGIYQSALQKYIAENPVDFQMKVALLYTMTEGFTKMGNVLKQTVKKEKNKAMKELEHVVNNTRRTPNGVIDMSGGSSFNGMKIAPKELWK